MFCNFCVKFENSKWPPFLVSQNFFENWHGYSAEISCGSKISSKTLYLARFSRYKHFYVLQILRKIRKFKMENLRIKLNFYKIISYLVDRCNSPAPSRSRQTLEKNVLSWALAWTGSVVFTRQVSPDTQLPYCACARMRTSSFCCLPSKVPLI